MRFAKLLWLAAPLIVLSGCSGDPTDDGSGDAFAIITQFNDGLRAVNEAFTITASVIDRGGTPLAIELQVNSGKPDVVVLDSTRFRAETQQTTVYAKALKVDAAGSPLVFSAAGVADTVIVRVH